MILIILVPNAGKIHVSGSDRLILSIHRRLRVVLGGGSVKCRPYVAGHSRIRAGQAQIIGVAGAREGGSSRVSQSQALHASVTGVRGKLVRRARDGTRSRHTSVVIFCAVGEPGVSFAQAASQLERLARSSAFVAQATI